MAEEQAIPDAVMSEACKIVDAAEDECRAAKCLVVFPTVRGKEALDKHIARALLAAELRGRTEQREADARKAEERAAYLRRNEMYPAFGLNAQAAALDDIAAAIRSQS